MKSIDMRSDTVTQPSEAMRKAMYEAEVGDDVFGDDPTVNRLQDVFAGMLGKPAALFFPSGTMSNQTAVKVHTNPGEEIICEADAHIYIYESAAPAAISGVSVHTLPGRRGVIYADQIRLAMKDGSDEHQPQTTLICLESSHNRAGGTVFPLDVMRNVKQMADAAGAAVHLDGARLFNAAAASGRPVKEYAACADTVNVCLSKGLGAPVGSMLAGSAETIAEARRVRKRLGGGMRQAGILAAAGLYALTNNVERLAEDHANAKRLAEGVAGLPGLEINPAEVETNILVIRVNHPRFSELELVQVLDSFGVRIVPFGRGRVRAVTNLHVTADDVDTAIAAFDRAVS